MFGEKCNVTATIRFRELLLNGLWKRAENFKNIIAFWCARARITAHLSRRTRCDIPFSWKMIFNTNSFTRQTSNLNHSCQGVLYTLILHVIQTHDWEDNHEMKIQTICLNWWNFDHQRIRLIIYDFGAVIVARANRPKLIWISEEIRKKYFQLPFFNRQTDRQQKDISKQSNRYRSQRYYYYHRHHHH